MDHNSILIESINQQGNIKATFECDHQVYFLYLDLADNDRFAAANLRPTTALWVANQIDDPNELDLNRCNDGLPPFNSKEFCQLEHRQIKDFCIDKLYFVWLREGTGVALYTNDQNLPLAIIPPWAIDQSWRKGDEVFRFSGYAYNAKGNGPLAWELTEDNDLIQKFSDAKLFWDDERIKKAYSD